MRLTRRTRRSSASTSTTCWSHSPIRAIKNGEEVTGNMTRVKVVKNKVAPPFREAEFEIMYGAGISREGEIIDLGSAQGIVEKSGARYTSKGSRTGLGKD